MKKTVFLALATVALASCSSDELINNSSADEAGSKAPIAFSVEKQNITRAEQSLESTKHYNFGVWAYKLKGDNNQLVMGNYLVGYSDGKGLGYANAGATTWANGAGTLDDHKSPWFYEKLGTEEYENTDATKGYVKTDNDFMSANKNQYLRYWDLAFDNTNFYAYAPYRSAGVSFNYTTKKIIVDQAAQTAEYDNPTLHEFMYAGATAKNADLKDVTLKFKHLGAQVNLRFYEDVRGYKVQIIDVVSEKDNSGIQATPATVKESGTPATKTYTKADYYTSCGATIDFSTITTPSASVNHTGATTTQENLKFVIPGKDNHLTDFTSKRDVNYSIIPEKVSTGTQTFAESPTVYYPVAQPESSEVGFTFHVSYKLIAEDNGEEITVKNARVYVPAKSGSDFIAAWQPNTKYTYTFKITENSTGSTDPTNPNIDEPTVPATPTVYPIVFDGATIEEYVANEKNY
jgi:hypothetical protein